jgi:hypothetical protein
VFNKPLPDSCTIGELHANSSSAIKIALTSAMFPNWHLYVAFVAELFVVPKLYPATLIAMPPVSMASEGRVLIM